MGFCSVLCPLFAATAGVSAAIGLSTTAAGGADTIRISGSSTVDPITKAAIKDYQATRSGKTVGFELKESG